MNNTELIARARRAQATAAEDFYSACDPELIGELVDALEAEQPVPQVDEADPLGDYADANRPSYAEWFGEPVATGDCRGCFFKQKHNGKDECLQDCTDFDKFSPASPIVLTKVTK